MSKLLLSWPANTTLLLFHLEVELDCKMVFEYNNILNFFIMHKFLKKFCLYLSTTKLIIVLKISSVVLYYAYWCCVVLCVLRYTFVMLA